LKAIITILAIVFIGWCIICTRWYVCEIKGLCTEKEVIPLITESEPKGNLTFRKLSTIPDINALTYQLIDSLKKTNRDTLLIVGKYFQDEVDGEKIGFERAKQVLFLLKSNEIFDPVKLESRLTSIDIGDEKYKGVYFESIINPEIESKSDFAFSIIGSKVVINFPVASADPNMNESLTQGIAELATKIKSEELEVLVSGHTDNTGTHETNLYYGQVRADAIAKMLIHDGVAQDKITVVSKGESVPVATNTTSEGKEKNRRVEIDLQSRK